MRPPTLRASFESELVVDSFAGGGGASTGIEAAIGRPVDIAPAAVTRFWSCVDASGPVPAHQPELGPCWLWTGTRQRRASGVASYGIFMVRKAKMLAHRVAWALAHPGEAAPPVVRHRCDNPGCVRPEHLVAGSQADNLTDMRERGRAHFNSFPRGTAHPNAKIDADTARAIRAMRSGTPRPSLAKIGAAFGLHPSTVHDIVTGRTWTDDHAAGANVSGAALERVAS